MEEKDLFFEENVKKAFKKAKEDINSLSERIDSIEMGLKEINNKLNILLVKKGDFGLNSENKREFSPENTAKDPLISTGHTYMHTDIHTTDIHPTYIHTKKKEKPEESIENLRIKDVEKRFKTLTKRELQIFLSIYQLEDEQKEPSYSFLARKLGIAQGGVRTHIRFMLQKRVPIVKEKRNNTLIILRIPQNFRNLNMKERITQWYYQMESSQTDLDSF